MVTTRRFYLGTTTLLGLGVAGLGLTASRAHAEPQTTAAPSLCQDDPGRTASTLTNLACSLRDGLPPLDRSTVVVSRPLDESSPESARAFAERLTLLLSNATTTRDGGLTSGPNPQSGPHAVLLLEPQLHGAVIHVNATLVGKRANVWARLRGEANQVLAHAFVSKPLDTEVRSYLPKLPLVRPKLTMYPAPLSQINAIACGDIDVDGALELALANRQDLALGSLTQQGFVPSRVAALSSLSEVAPVPLREPLAALWFHGTALEASTTDRYHWLQLNTALAPIAKRANQWGIAPGLCVSRSSLPSLATAFDCQSPPKLTDATSPVLDSAVGFDYAAFDDAAFGKVQFAAHHPKPRVLASRDAATATLTVQTPTRTWTLPERGAQVAIADLNHDGTLEIVTTSATLARGADQLYVHSLPDSANAPVLQWQLAVPTGIDAVAACPADGLGQAAIVFASNDHIGVAQ